MNYYTYHHTDAVNFHRHLNKGLDLIIDHATLLHKHVLPCFVDYLPEVEGYVQKVMGHPQDGQLDDLLNKMGDLFDNSPYTLNASPFPISDATDSYPLMVNTVKVNDKRHWVFLMMPYPTNFVSGALAREKLTTLALAYKRSHALINVFAPAVRNQHGLPAPSSVTVCVEEYIAYKACMENVANTTYMHFFKPKTER